jgi:hypothetical protein
MTLAALLASLPTTRSLTVAIASLLRSEKMEFAIGRSATTGFADSIGMNALKTATVILRRSLMELAT